MNSIQKKIDPSLSKFILVDSKYRNGAEEKRRKLSQRHKTDEMKGKKENNRVRDQGNSERRAGYAMAGAREYGHKSNRTKHGRGKQEAERNQRKYDVEQQSGGPKNAAERGMRLPLGSSKFTRHSVAK